MRCPLCKLFLFILVSFLPQRALAQGVGGTLLTEMALNDSQNRVSSTFSVPEELKPRVRFWLRVYSEWSSLQSPVFDSDHPEILYEVLDFTELRAKSRNRVVYEILREKK